MNKDTNTYSAAGEVGSVLENRSTFTRLKIELNKAPLTAKFGIFVIIVFVGLAIFAPLIAPYGEAEVFPEPYAPWSAIHIFGTDQIGRDIFSRLIFGAQNTVGVAFATTILAFLIGGALGLAAAINRSYLDLFLSRAVDVLMAIPQLIFALVLLSIFGSTVINLIIIIAVLDSTRVFRLTRAVSLNVVVMDYVEVAKLRGENISWVMRKEILPNILPPLIAEFGLRFCFVFLSIAALSFLGVGIQPPTPSWGLLIAEGKEAIFFQPWLIILPGIALFILVVSINMMGDGLRDITDPNSKVSDK